MTQDMILNTIKKLMDEQELIKSKLAAAMVCCDAKEALKLTDRSIELAEQTSYLRSLFEHLQITALKKERQKLAEILGAE